MAKGLLESRVVVIRDLELTAKIGVYTHERQDSQPIRINLAMTVGVGPMEDRLKTPFPMTPLSRPSKD
mgnify:CR=1 FL=1